jgi:spore maturation protein CgeB
MKMLSLGAAFMEPYWAPEVETLISVDLHRDLPAQIEPHADAAFAYAMNTVGGENIPKLWDARDICRRMGIPTVWATIEDPNAFQIFLPQADGFDVIATSDAVLIPQYRQWHPSARVIWLPLAAQPAMHRPLNPVPGDEIADFVLLANWYTNEARLGAVRTLLDPLIDARYSLALYAYATPAWPSRFRRFWRGATSVYDVANFYPTGRVALGLNNQAWGTAMTSMRTFEALACGKPFLAYYSDAYERLGFVNGEHFVWTDDPQIAVATARVMLMDRERAATLADQGRAFVLERHTYRHRLQVILDAVNR